MREVREVSAIEEDKLASCPALYEEVREVSAIEDKLASYPALYEGNPKCQRFKHNMTGIA